MLGDYPLNLFILIIVVDLLLPLFELLFVPIGDYYSLGFEVFCLLEGGSCVPEALTVGTVGLNVGGFVQLLLNQLYPLPFLVLLHQLLLLSLEIIRLWG